MYDETLKKIIKDLEKILSKDDRWFKNNDSNLKTKMKKIGMDRVIKVPTYFPIHVDYPDEDEYTKPKFDFQKEEENIPEEEISDTKKIKVFQKDTVNPKLIMDKTFEKPDIKKIKVFDDVMTKPKLIMDTTNPKIVSMNEDIIELKNDIKIEPEKIITVKEEVEPEKMIITKEEIEPKMTPVIEEKKEIIKLDLPKNEEFVSKSSFVPENERT